MEELKEGGWKNLIEKLFKVKCSLSVNTGKVRTIKYKGLKQEANWLRN